jgi:hypothetical protein
MQMPEHTGIYKLHLEAQATLQSQIVIAAVKLPEGIAGGSASTCASIGTSTITSTSICPGTSAGTRASTIISTSTSSIISAGGKSLKNFPGRGLPPRAS